MLPYNSKETRYLFNSKPVYVSKNGRDHRYTTSISGYCKAAHKQASFLFKNQKLKPNYWFLTINFHEVQSRETIKKHKKIWNNCCRNFKRLGINAFYSLEISRSNRFHYHLLINSVHTKKVLLQIIKRSMPHLKDGKQDNWHKCLEPVKDWGLPNYILKARIRGEIDGVQVKDYYAKKRVLFKSGLGLRKVGTIGDYWHESIDSGKARKREWDEVIRTEKQIYRGLRMDSRIPEYAKRVSDLTKQSYEKVKREFAYFGVSDKSIPVKVEEGYESEEIN